jgi:hypothetical protein
MTNDMPQSFVRRARLSSKAIIAALALTLAALIALVIASRDKDTTTVKVLSPVTDVSHTPAGTSTSASGLVPVVNRVPVANH